MVKKLFAFTERKKLQQEIANLKDQVTKDPLTGLLNRRGFDEALAPLVESVSWYLKNPMNPQRQTVIIKALSLLVIDLDKFKPINDKFGHQVGDRVLKQVAHKLQAETRSIDLVARWGGDEFAVALVGAGADEANTLANKLQSAIGNISIGSGQKNLKVRASIGIATLSSGMDENALFKAADKALYQTKDQ